jgi:voltage-gated potassium channel
MVNKVSAVETWLESPGKGFGQVKGLAGSLRALLAAARFARYDCGAATLPLSSMTHNPLAWIGLAGVEPDDNPRALYWQARLHGIMVGIALLAVPAYVFESLAEFPLLHRIATVLDVAIFAAFLAEALWMASVSSHPMRYLLDNWLNQVILVGAFASVLGATTEWIALVRVMRVAIAGLVMLRTITGFSVLFTRRGAPILVGAAFLILLCAGGMFYWLEPTVDNYWDGLWLAFVTGMTIGYGDVVPTTGTARVVAAGIGLIGVALVTLFTASVVSFFVGGEETQLRRDLQRDIVQLREEIGRLFDTEEIRFREDLHRDIVHLRRQIGELVHAEELQFRKQFQHEIAQLRADVAALAAELRLRDARSTAAPPPADER